MSKLLKGIATGVLLLLFWQLPAQTPITVRITPKDVAVNVNQTFTVDVTAENFTKIVSLQFPIEWNSAVIEYDTITNINATGLAGASLSNNFGISPGKISFFWFDQNFTPRTLPSGAVLFTIKFKAKQNGTTQVALTNSAPGIEASDENENIVPVTPVAATVKVGDGGNSGPTPLSLALSDPSVQVNDQVCIQLTATNFTSLIGVQFSLSYNANQLQFVQARNFNSQVTGLSAASITNPSPGVLRFQWNEASSTGKTIPAGAVLLELCFTAKTVGAAAVTFTGTPLNISATQKIGTNPQQAVTVQTNNANITITEPSNGGGFQLRMNDATTQPGGEICIPVLVSGFQDIVGLQFTVRYDANLLQFVEARNFNSQLPGLDATGLTNPSAGILRFQWNDGGFSGIDLPNGTAIYELCFKARTAGTASVAFSGNPLAIEVTQKLGADDQQVIDFTTKNASITIEGDNTGGGPGFAGFGVYMEDYIVNSGDQVCVAVKVQDFIDILGMQFSIKYDPDALQFVEVRNFGLNGLNAASMNTNTPGVIALQWDDPTAAGQDLNNGDALFEICFTVKAKNGKTTNVTFEDRPTPIEFTRKANNNLGQETIDDYQFRNARIIIGDGSQGFDGFGFLLSNATPQSGDNFCLDLSVQDFKAIVGAQFTIDYDPALLEYDTVNSFNLAGLGDDAFGNPEPGKITFRWFDPSVAGITLPNNTVIFKVCFRAVGPNGATTLVTFSDSPTAVEAVQKSGQTEVPVPDVGFKIGKVEIGGGVPTIVNPVSLTNVNCFGQSTGAINIEMRGGTGSFSYKWSYQNATTQDLSNIPAGTYTVTVTDNGNSLTTTGTYEITQPAAALNATQQVTDATCQGGGANGSIALTVTGGTSPYNINWSGTLTDNVTSQTTLSAGKYSFTITDSKGCTFTSPEIQVRQQATNQVTLTPASVNQGNDGAITAAVSGGGTPFTFKWSGPGNFSSTQQNLSGLNATGQYCVSVTNADGCVTEACVTLFAVLKFGQVNVVNSCAGTNNGRITLNMSGGQAPYTYQWSPGNGATASLSNLAPANYSVTVTDARGDKINGMFEVTSLPAISIAKVIDPVTGDEANKNGAIRLTVTGGRPGYTIAWNNGSTGAQLTNLGVGNYCVTVTDQNTCTASECFDVALQLVPLSFTAQTKSTSCNGKADGEVALTILGGRLPYEVTFADGTKLNSSDGKVSRGSMAAGAVNFTIKDGNGKELTGTATIPQPEPLRIAEAVVVHDTEDPGCTGRISLTIAGGTPGYQVAWNSPNTGAQIINLCAGPFVPTVADARGCTATFDPIQVNTFGASGQVTNASCLSEANGSVTLNVNGGASPYTYKWANESGQEVGTAANLTDVKPGKYKVTISEKSGNRLVREFVIGATSNLSAQATVLSNFEGFGVSCPQAKDGRLQGVGANGIGAYAYEWTRGEEMLGTEATLNNVGAGIYELTVIDEGGCVATKTVEVKAPPVLVINPNVSNVSCNGSTNGAVEVRISGGANNNLFTYQWSNGGNGNRIGSLPAGAYSLTVTDRFGCTVSGSYQVREPRPLVVTVETTPANEGCNGTALAKISGGTAPYIYRWNSTQTDSLITRLCPGTYTVEVLDSRGCKPQQPSNPSGFVGDRRFPCMVASVVLTPNGDGDNEVFQINCIEEFPNNHLEIYNRWGELVYEAENYDNSWNGRAADGSRIPEGAYYFVLQYVDGNGTSQQLKGALTVLYE